MKILSHCSILVRMSLIKIWGSLASKRLLLPTHWGQEKVIPPICFATNNLFILSLNSLFCFSMTSLAMNFYTHQCLHHVGLSITKSFDRIEDVHHVLVLDHLHQDVAGTVHSAAATAVPRQTREQQAQLS